MHHSLSKIYHTPFYHCLDLLYTDSLPPCFKLNQGDVEFLLDAHLLIRSDTINLFFQLIHNAVHISDALGCALSFSIWWKDLKLHMLVSSDICHLVNLFLCRSFHLRKVLQKVLLGPVTIVTTSCNSCCLWCLTDLSKSLHITGVTWWILRSNRSFALCRSASDHLVVLCQAQFRCTWNCLRFVVVTDLAPYSWTSMGLPSLCNFRSRNWWDSLANGLSTWPSQTSTVSVLEMHLSSCEITSLYGPVQWRIDHSYCVG